MLVWPRRMALRRLREEIDAAFEAQRRSSSSHRHTEGPSEDLTSKWAQVTALLASAGRPAVQTRGSGAKKHLSRPLAPVKHFAMGEKHLHMTEKDKRTLLRQLLVEWRRFARSTAVVTRLYVRARRRGDKRLLAAVLTAWRRRVKYQRKLQRAVGLVEKQEQRATLAGVWTRWTCEQEKARKVRVVRLRRRTRRTCEAFCTWVLSASRRRLYRRYTHKAAKLLLRRYWRWLVAGIGAQRAVNDEVERLYRRRVMDLLECCVLRWGEYVEERKRWEFAVKWSDKRILGDAYDFWRDSHEQVRNTRYALQLAARRRRRRLLGYVLDEWNRYARREQLRKRALVIMLHKQTRRNAFVHLVLNAQSDRKQESALQDWKTRRAVRIWLARSHRCRVLRLRAAFLKENHDLVMLRKIAWTPWRRSYLRSVALCKFTSRRRACQLRKVWVAFVAAVNQQEWRRIIVASMIDRREVRHLRDVVFEWRFRVNSMRERKELIARTRKLWQRRLLHQILSGWRVAHHIVRREKSLAMIATQHLALKMIQHWTRWAYWSKRELTGKIAAVIERRQQQRVRQFIVHWRQVVRARHKTLYRKVFNSWKKATEVQHLERHIQELRRLVQLRWRWQRWRLHIFQCQEVRCTTTIVSKMHAMRLLRHSFMTVWLAKTRGYSMGSGLLKRFGERHLLRVILTRWRENHSRRSAMKRADTFRCKKLQCQYLRKFYALTVARSQTAASCARRRHLVQAWGSWVQYYMLKRRRLKADAHFRRHSKQKAVRLLKLTAVGAIKRRNQQIEAEAWHEAVLLQRVICKWFLEASHAKRCQLVALQLSWNTVGRRAFRVWQDALLEKQHLLRAGQFRSVVLLRRTWNALFRITKRRQVALAMLGHVTKRIRSARVFSLWRNVTDERRGQYVVAVTMCRMQQQRTRQILFTAWSGLVAARRLASRLNYQEYLRWRQVCWAHWKLWRVQQQACREICVRTARHVLHRSLARWQVELWLARNQKKLATEGKRKAFTRWRTYVQACRQKRRWEHYIQQLHRSERGSKAVRGQSKRRKAGIFYDTRALQAQLKRSRVLMTHVLHAWYLVVQNRQRRSLVKVKKSRRPAMERNHSTANGRQEALEFWARRVTQKCFVTWREVVVGKRAALA